MKLLCAFDVPLGAQVAEGPELLPPTADGALVDLQDAGEQSVNHMTSVQAIVGHPELLLLLKAEKRTPSFLPPLGPRSRP